MHLSKVGGNHGQKEDEACNGRSRSDGSPSSCFQSSGNGIIERLAAVLLRREGEEVEEDSSKYVS
jgi:hypothetical protein